MPPSVHSYHMTRSDLWPVRRVISMGIVVVVFHMILLFLVLPKVSARLAPSYNQDRYTDGYEQLTENLALGHGYRFYPETARTIMREPGYPMFLAGLRLFFGDSFLVVKLANLVLALVTAWLILELARKIDPGAPSREGQLLFLPPVLFLFHPAVLIAESRGGLEIVVAFLAVLFLLSVLRMMRTQRLSDAIVSGVLLGIIIYVRSTPVLFPFFLCGYLLLFERRRARILRTCRNMAVIFITMLVVLSPWIARNYGLTGKFIATGDVLGVSAQAGQYIGTHLFEGRPWWLLDREASRERDRVAVSLGYAYEDGQNGYYQTFYKTTDEVKFSDYLLKKVVNTYKRSPLLFIRCLAQNLFNFWCAGKTWSATAANTLLQVPLLVLAGIGTIRGLKDRGKQAVGLLVLFIGYVMAVHLPILAQARYSVPLIPLVSILASMGLVAVRRTEQVSATPEGVAV
jgi:4-amino-4-deoxy-L-arabinose transferase-like glycosyltransferase